MVSVSIAGNIDTVGDFAFSSCASLQTITAKNALLGMQRRFRGMQLFAVMLVLLQINMQQKIRDILNRLAAVQQAEVQQEQAQQEQLQKTQLQKVLLQQERH